MATLIVPIGCCELLVVSYFGIHCCTHSNHTGNQRDDKQFDEHCCSLSEVENVKIS